jgi:hypothetical protein
MNTRCFVSLVLGLSLAWLPRFEAFAQATDPPPGLVAWWTGDGNARDELGVYHGTASTGFLYPTGLVGQAFGFDSSDDRVSIPHASVFNLAPPGFTVHFWMRASGNQPGSDSALVEKSHGFTDTSGWAFQVRRADGKPRFAVGTAGGWAEVSATNSCLDEKWHHLAGTWDGAMIRLFVDGVLHGMAANTAPANNNRPLNFGFAAGGWNPQRFLVGGVDEVAIHQAALTAGEIAAVARAGGARGGGGGNAPGSAAAPVVRRRESQLELGQGVARFERTGRNVGASRGRLGRGDGGGGFSGAPEVGNQ